MDQVLYSEEEGDIHYHVYIPESYDGSRPYALYLTLPGYEGLYFQGVAANLKYEEFAFEAQKYNDEMIIVAPQLNDWGGTSASQTIALTEYFLDTYNIDKEKVYGNGYSGGGETMSLVMGRRPDLFTAYLHVSSQWDGAYEPVAEQRLPVYFAIGQNDEYYGSGPTREAYDTLYGLYEHPEDVNTDGVDAIAGASIVVKDTEVMGNTEYVAGMIQETVGGDLFRIETVQAYPLDHDPLVDQAAREQDEDARPALSAHIENPEQYDTIILGFPNWWGDLPQPLYTFLEEYDFSGKTIIPFVTHGGSGFSGTRETISRLQPEAAVGDNPLSLSRGDVAGSRDEVIAWAEGLGL